MTDTDRRTEPALTAEEWEHGEVQGAMLDGDRLYVYANSYCGEADEDDRHALAALALYGQPFGFSWEDVDLLEDLIPSHARHLTAPVLARIAALLPPR